MCQHCGQKFFSYPNMLKHVRRNHLGLRPHQCQICEKRFCERQELQNHMRTHTGEKKPVSKKKRTHKAVEEPEQVELVVYETT